MPHLVTDFLDWFNWSLNKNPALFVTILLVLIIPGVVAIWWQAQARGTLKTRFGWVERRKSPTAFRWTMRYLLTVIMGLVVLLIYMTIKALA